jgi:putative resolvase
MHDAPAPHATLAYARVASHDQKGDMERQKQVLELYCASQGWTFEVVADLGSGMNYHKKGLSRLLDAILAGGVGRLEIVHKDRLLRFGAELVFAICEAKQVEVVIINQSEEAASRRNWPRTCSSSSPYSPPGCMAVAVTATAS